MGLHSRVTAKSVKSHCLSPKPDFTQVSPCCETVWAAITNRQIWGKGEDGGVSHCFWVFPTLKLVDTDSTLGGVDICGVPPSFHWSLLPLFVKQLSELHTQDISGG